MKKIIIFLATAAIAALAVVSCNKNETDITENAGRKVSVRISGTTKDAAIVDPSTRTYISESGGKYIAKWDNQGEELGIIVGDIDKNTKANKLVAEATTENNPIFTGSITAEEGGPYNMFLFYPFSAFGTAYDDGGIGIDLENTQHPVLGSFDPAADLLGYSTDNVSVENGSLVMEGITLQRPMAILRINLNADSDAKAYGQKVSSLKMEVPSSMILTGRAKFIAGGEMTWNPTLKFNYVKAEIADTEEITVGETDGVNAVYLVVNPLEIASGTQITFNIETEDYNGTTTISRTITAKEDMQFQAGNVNVINLKLRDKDIPTVSDKNYVKVNSDADLVDGQYLIVYEEGSVALNGGLTTLDANNNYIDVVITDETIPSTTTTDAASFTISVSDGSILSASGLYIGNTSDANSLKTNSTEAFENTISINSDKEADIVSAATHLRYNPSSGTCRFRYFKSATYTSQKAIALYRLDEAADPTPVITFAGEKDGMVEKEITSAATSVVFSYTKNRYVTELPTYTFYSGSGCVDGEVTVTDEAITVPISANPNTAPRFIYLDVTGQGIDGTIRLAIKQAAYEAATTISTILADITITSTNTVSYEVDGVTVMASQGRNYIIADATGVMLLYAPSGTTLTVGKQYKVSGGVKLYNGVHEYTGSLTITESTGTAPAAGTPEAMTVASLTAYASAPITKYAVVTATAQSSGYLCSDGTNTINVYDGTGTWSQFYGKDVKVTGYLIGFYSSKINMIATAIEDNSNPDTPTLSVSATSLIWEANEYGASSAKQVTVTLNAGVDEDNYNIDGSSNDWVVTPYSGSANTVSVYPKAANTGSAAKTFTFKVVHGDDTTVYKEISCSQAMSAPLTIADILSGGANTYAGTTDELLVYAVSGSNAIVGDSSGKMLLYKSGHGLAVGDIFTITNATVVLYNSSGNNVLEITGGTFDKKSTGNTVNHGTPADLDDSAVAQSNVTAFSGTYSHSAVFVKMTGSQVQRNITNANNVVLYLSAANSATDGKSVSTTGYIYGYNTTKANFNYQMVSIEENINPDTPTLSVSATSLNWSATESGQSSAKPITVTLNSGVDEDNYNIEGSSTDWEVTPYSGSANVVSVYPKAANTGSTAKTFTFKVVHGDDATVYKEITCTQAAPSSGGGTTYTKVTSAPSDWSGTYIIVYEESSTSGLVCLAGTDGYQNWTTATINSGVISSNDLSDYEVEIASYSKEYSIKALGGANKNMYLEGKGSSSNGTSFVSSASKETTFSISSGAVTITNNTNLFVYNSTSGANGERWRFYKSGTAAGSAYKKPALYKKN